MENLYECQGFGQDTPCIHAPLDASSLLVPCLLLVQLENWHVLQDGWLRSISKSWAEGWKSEETRKHLFENWVALIESVNLWIRSVQFMNEFRPVLWTWFFEKIWCKVYTLFTSWMSLLCLWMHEAELGQLSRLLLNSCSNCGVFLHKAIIWLQRTLIYCTDYSIFTFIILTRITRLFFRNSPFVYN